MREERQEISIDLSTTMCHLVFHKDGEAKFGIICQTDTVLKACEEYIEKNYNTTTVENK